MAEPGRQGGPRRSGYTEQAQAADRPLIFSTPAEPGTGVQQAALSSQQSGRSEQQADCDEWCRAAAPVWMRLPVSICTVDSFSAALPLVPGVRSG